MKKIIIDGVEYSLTPIKKTEPIIAPIIIEQHLKFEVYPEDLGEFTWEDAKEACAKLGDGWRLPTREELHLMWLNRDTIGGFAAANYWSSSENYNSFAWTQGFYYGLQSYSYKSLTFYVRAVRDIKK